MRIYAKISYDMLNYTIINQREKEIEEIEKIEKIENLQILKILEILEILEILNCSPSEERRKDN